MEIDPRKSLLQHWAAAEEDVALEEDIPQHLVTKPLRRLSPAELWYLISRNVALEYLVPLALEKLETDPLLQANRYPGDLLTALLEARTTFWRQEYDLWLETAGLVATAVERITTQAEQGELGDYMPAYLGDDFMGALMHFRGIHEA